MKMRFNKSIILICGFLLLLVEALAQNTVEVAVTTMILDDGVTTEDWVGDSIAGVEGLGAANLFLVSGGRSRAIAVPFGSVSPAFVYRGPREMVFYHEPVSVIADAPPPSISANVTIPDGADEVLLIFFTDNLEQQRFRVLPIAMDASRAKPNSMRISNYTNQDLAWMFGSERGQLEAGESASASISNQSITSRIRIAQFDAEANRWRIVFNRILRPGRGQRYECFILPRPGRGGEGVMVRIFTDHVDQRNRTTERGGVPLRVEEPEEAGE